MTDERKEVTDWREGTAGKVGTADGREGLIVNKGKRLMRERGNG